MKILQYFRNSRKKKAKITRRKLPTLHNFYGDELSPDKSYLQTKVFSLVLTLLAVGIAYYLIYCYGIQHFYVAVNTSPATLSTVSISCETESYIFRDETVLRAASGRSSIPAVTNGSHVASGTTVAQMYDESTPDTVAQLEILDKQLKTLNDLKNKSISSRDIVSIDNSIYDTMLSVSSAGREGDASTASALKGALLSELNRRSMLVGSFSNVDNAIASLTSQKTQLLNSLGICRQTVYAQKSGYYYSEADGYESVFSAETALSMTPAKFLELTEYTAENITATAGKIATSYLWYTACLMPAEYEQYMTVNRKYSLTFPANNNTVLTCTLVRCEDCKDGENVMAVFSCGTLPEDFLFTRCQRIIIMCKEYTGYRVPYTALHVENGVTSVYILVGSIVRSRYAKVLYRSEDFVLLEQYTPDEKDVAPPSVTVQTAGKSADSTDGSTAEVEVKDYYASKNWLKRNNIIITSGKNLYDGKILTAK